MRKLCLVPALLLAAASASAETPVKLWNDYVYNQPVESVKAEAGIFDCSQRGQQMFCRANVEFAGHKDWGGFRAPMAVQDETGKSMLEETKSK